VTCAAAGIAQRTQIAAANPAHRYRIASPKLEPLPIGQRMTCERTDSLATGLGERTRINARRSVIPLPFGTYALGWSMRLLDGTVAN
jgi:hypothetical protein